MSTVIVPKLDILKSLEEATEAYHAQLLTDDPALQYLMKDRGLSKEALEYFRLGVVRDPQQGHENYKNRLVFPYITDGGVTSVRFRYLGDPGERSKFLSVAGDGARPYNVKSLRGNSEVFVCEGETDTIGCWMAGLPAVGFPGAETWEAKDESDQKLGFIFARMLYNRKVTVLADNDDKGAGSDFAKDVLRFLGGCAIINMPPGYDVSKFVLDFGTEALREKVHYEKRSSGDD